MQHAPLEFLTGLPDAGDAAAVSALLLPRPGGALLITGAVPFGDPNIRIYAGELGVEEFGKLASPDPVPLQFSLPISDMAESGGVAEDDFKISTAGGLSDRTQVKLLELNRDGSLRVAPEVVASRPAAQIDKQYHAGAALPRTPYTFVAWVESDTPGTEVRFRTMTCNSEKSP